jgi:hypothetical protein
MEETDVGALTGWAVAHPPALQQSYRWYLILSEKVSFANFEL